MRLLSILRNTEKARRRKAFCNGYRKEKRGHLEISRLVRVSKMAKRVLTFLTLQVLLHKLNGRLLAH